MAPNIQNGCHGTKIGQNLPIHIRKLQFEVVILIDCMFYALAKSPLFIFKSKETC